MTPLPYVTAPGNVIKALRGIATAATPDRVSQDFVKTILNITGGSGDQMTSYLKKIGFANSDGTPSEIYRKFRNESSRGQACAEATRVGYKPLFVKNEYFYKLADPDLKGLIVEVTGQAADSSAVSNIFACLKGLLSQAKFDQTTPVQIAQQPETGSCTEEENVNTELPSKLGLNLSYTINLNLPATTDVSVFNAIFKSLKENLLKE
jgi:Family of unknown function (DUF5343)